MPDVRKNIDVVIRAQDETRRGVDTASRSVDKLGKSFADVVGKVTAVTAAVGASLFVLRNFSEQIDRISINARRLGVTTEEAQRLSYVAQFLDADMEGLGRSIFSVQGRAELLAEPLRKIGISLEDIRRLEPTDVLERMAEGFAGLETQQERSAVAYKLFNERGREMLGIFAEGADAIRRFKNEAPIIDEKTLRNAAEFNDTWDKIVANLKAAAAVNLSNVKDALASGANPYGRDVSTGLTPGQAARAGIGPGVRLRGPRPFQLPEPGPILSSPGLDMVSILAAQGAAAARDLRPAGMRDFEMPRVGDIEPILKTQQELRLEVDRTRDAYDALGEGLRAIEAQGESLGATLVDGAFRWADSWSRGMALVTTKQAEFADIGKRLFRAMVTDMLAWINRLIARQIVSAVLSSILGGGGGNVAGAIQAASAAAGGGGGAVPMGLPESSRAFRPPQVATGDFGRPVVVQASISTVFGSQGEVRAAAAQLKRIMERV